MLYSHNEGNRILWTLLLQSICQETFQAAEFLYVRRNERLVEHAFVPVYWHDMFCDFIMKCLSDLCLWIKYLPNTRYTELVLMSLYHTAKFCYEFITLWAWLDMEGNYPAATTTVYIPLLLTLMNFTPPGISNLITSNVCDELIYPSPKFNFCSVEVSGVGT